MYLLKYLDRSVICMVFVWLLFTCLVATPVAAQQATNADSAATAGVTDPDGGAVPAGGSQPTTQEPQKVEQGKTLFNNNCATCHAVTAETVVGPGLKGVNERRPEAWLISWIKNPAKVLATGDQYANDLYNKYNKTPMPAFDFTDDEIRSILAYIDVSGTGEAANTVAGGDGAEGKNVPSGDGAGNDTAGGGMSSGYFTVILVALLVILLLVLVVLIMIVSLLTKFLRDKKDLSEEDREVVEQKVDVNKILSSNAFKGGAIILAFLILGKIGLDNVMKIGISQGYAPDQPIAFSHKLHAGQYQIDCNYCHTTVTKSKNASVPSANICMNCHGVIKNTSPEIKKIYAAIENDRPIEWIRVHNLPDLAYFNHSQHVNVGGVACQSCHGEIQNMEIVQQVAPLTMGWCIDCHRKTEVNAKDNAYYDKLVALHNSKEPMKVANIGGIECSKCHY